MMSPKLHTMCNVITLCLFVHVHTMACMQGSPPFPSLQQTQALKEASALGEGSVVSLLQGGLELVVPTDGLAVLVL